MSNDALRWTFALPLRPGTKLVLLALADAADAEGECWPTRGTIARKTGFSVRAVDMHLAVLRAMGLVRVQAQFREWRGQVHNIYALALPDFSPAPANDLPPGGEAGGARVVPG